MFTIGQKVIAKENHGPSITAGKEYVVVDLIYECRFPHFTFPKYVVVIGDFGKEVTAYDWRFKNA